VLDRGAPDDVVGDLRFRPAIALDPDGEQLRVRTFRKAVGRLEVGLELIDLLQLAGDLRFRAVVVVESVSAESEDACADEDGPEVHGAGCYAREGATGQRHGETIAATIFNGFRRKAARLC
jgi:hypothetical protein